MEELYVDLISEAKGKYKCAIVNEEGEQKQKFTLEFSKSKLEDMTQDLMFMDKITRDMLLSDLKRVLANEIMEKCGELRKYVNYSDLCTDGAADDIASTLSNCLEERVYDAFHSMYGLSDEQLEEIKKFYNEGIDLNLATKKTEGQFMLGKEMLSADEMRKVRLSIENEWKESMGQGRRDTSEFKESLKVEGMTQPYLGQEEERSIPKQEEREI